jgi:hypothetical protein
MDRFAGQQTWFLYLKKDWSASDLSSVLFSVVFSETENT